MAKSKKDKQVTFKQVEVPGKHKRRGTLTMYAVDVDGFAVGTVENRGKGRWLLRDAKGRPLHCALKSGDTAISEAPTRSKAADKLARLANQGAILLLVMIEK